MEICVRGARNSVAGGKKYLIITRKNPIHVWRSFSIMEDALSFEDSVIASSRSILTVTKSPSFYRVVVAKREH